MRAPGRVGATLLRDPDAVVVHRHELGPAASGASTWPTAGVPSAFAVRIRRPGAESRPASTWTCCAAQSGVAPRWGRSPRWRRWPLRPAMRAARSAGAERAQLGLIRGRHSESAGGAGQRAEREFARALEHPWRVVWALTAFALVLRFATLDARGFWLDEAITVDLIRGSLGDVMNRLDAYTLDQPPLYYLLAWGWAQVFGTGEVGLRSRPAICGALAVPVAYLAATELFSKRAGLVAALLTALSPLVVWHSQDARPYALLILLGGASFALFVRVLHDRRPRVVAGWAAAAALAMATHYAAGFPVAAEVIWLLFSIRRRTAVVTVWPGSRRWARGSCSSRREGPAGAPSATASGPRAIPSGSGSSRYRLSSSWVTSRRYSSSRRGRLRCWPGRHSPPVAREDDRSTPPGRSPHSCASSASASRCCWRRRAT